MTRLRRRLRATGLTVLAVLVLAAMTAPLAVALESTDSTLDDTTDSTTETTTDTTTDTTEDTTLLDDPSPSPSEEETVDDTTETVDGTADDTDETLEETSDELDSTVTTVSEPSPSPSPTDDQDDENSDQDTDDDTSEDASTGTTSDDAASSDGAGTSTSDGPSGTSPDGADDGRETRAASRTITLPEYRASRSISPRAWDAMIGETPPFDVPRAPSGPPAHAVDPAAVFGDLPDLSQALFGLEEFAVPPGGRSTHDILDRLAAAGADIATAAKVLAPFPVIGPATYGDDWHAPRDGGARLHEGTDIFAPRGTPVAASFDGAIGRIWVGAELGGNAFTVRAPDGTYAYYSHLDSFVPGLSVGKKVEQGDILGYVGDTGNAVGTPPHLHFELHPGGGAAVPPIPYLDRWLSAARAEVLLVGSGASSIATSLQVPAFEPYTLPEIAPPDVDAPAVDAPAAGPAASTPEPRSSRLDGAPVRQTSDATTPLLTLLSLTLCFWYFVVRGRGDDEPVTAEVPSAPDTLAPLLADDAWTVPTPVRAGPRDVLEPLMNGDSDGRAPDGEDEVRDVLAPLLTGSGTRS